MMVRRACSRRTPAADHLVKFYDNFEVRRKDRYYDGLIITGAPVEHLAYEEVDYWEELTRDHGLEPAPHVYSTIAHLLGRTGRRCTIIIGIRKAAACQQKSVRHLSPSGSAMNTTF